MTWLRVSQTNLPTTNFVFIFVLTNLLQNLATIDFEVSEDKSITWQDPVIITVTGDVTPDPDMENYVKEATEPLRDPALDKNLAICKTMLDGRFLSIRTQETGLGNLVCDASKFLHSQPV